LGMAKNRHFSWRRLLGSIQNVRRELFRLIPQISAICRSGAASPYYMLDTC